MTLGNDSRVTAATKAGPSPTVRRAGVALARIDPRMVFAAVLLASAALLLILLSHLSFSSDEWDYLLGRRGFNLDVLLRPHAQHIVLGPVLIYKAIQATFGMESLFPYAVVSTASFLVSVALLFEYLRRRVDKWLALAGTLPLLFMGNAYEVLLWPINVSFTVSVAAGVGALLALEREDRRGDAAACGLLVLGVTFSEVALVFALGAVVSLVLERRSWSRAYVIAVPLVLYAAWYAGWGHTAESTASLHNVLHSPVYLVEGLASSVWSLIGVPPHHRPGGIWPALLGLAVVAVLRRRVRTPLPTAFWSALAILLAFWLLTAISFEPGREPHAPRYQYVGVVLLLLVLGNALVGIRLPAPAVLALVAGACLATIANLAVLGNRFQYLLDFTTKERGALAALELAAPAANPNLVIDRGNTDIIPLYSLSVGPYLSAVRDFGSPAYDPSSLARAPEKARAAADQILVLAELPMGPVHQRVPLGGPPPGVLDQASPDATQRGSCLTLQSAGGVSPVITLPHPGVTVTPPGGARETITLRRFATSSFPVSRQLEGTEALINPLDRSSRQWQAQIRGPGPTKICRLR
jgi:hypothetical protein